MGSGEEMGPDLSATFGSQVLMFDFKMDAAQNRVIKLNGPVRNKEKNARIVFRFPKKNGQKAVMRIKIGGVLKSNPKTWRDLGRYAREVLTTQDTQRFALGFTLCGSITRLWEFDRAGAVASSPFNIHEDGLRFVSAMLGFLLMNDTQLGYDPTIMCTSDWRKSINITRNGQPERLMFDGPVKRVPYVAGRATTCWKAHREGDKTNARLVIKDLEQYPKRGEEGKLLTEATEKDVVNTARYYYHETVQVGGKVDDICDNVRKGLVQCFAAL
ncbi:hypothetical protein GB937_010802 [Aspergillus fischeri]|nr:hypothetical protein GB937_010802 [Aspergillus fischeri]